MRDVKRIYPDSSTLSTLLKILKLLHKSQLVIPTHPAYTQLAQKMLMQIDSQLRFSQHILYQFPIILNSFMDLCVKLQMPE